jgi:hypothetical protein
VFEVTGRGAANNVADAVRRESAITPSRSPVLFAATGGDNLRRDQQFFCGPSRSVAFSLFFTKAFGETNVHKFRASQNMARKKSTPLD